MPDPGGMIRARFAGSSKKVNAVAGDAAT
jgi:hypothetical protein